MAGGQDVRFRGRVLPGERVEVRRVLESVERKGKAPGFLLLTVAKTYGTDRGELIGVTERFIIR
ncbi:hypothetical protein D3C83_219940 [compost metagenome]